jgi:hypothetical protein
MDRSWHETIFEESLFDIYHYYGMKSNYSKRLYLIYMYYETFCTYRRGKKVFV